MKNNYFKKIKKLLGRQHKTVSKDPYAAREADRYDDPIPSREFIVDHMLECGELLSLEQLMEVLALKTPEKKEALLRRLNAMVRDGQIVKNRRDAYGLPDKMNLITGEVIGHKEGFGLLSTDQFEETISFSAREMRKVFHGDRVLVRLAGQQDRRGRQEGIILKVLERHTQQITGRFFIESGVSFITPMNQRIPQQIIVPAKHRKGAKEGQIVVVQLLTEPSLRVQATGKIIEIVGDYLAPGMEVEVAIRKYDIPHVFSSAVIKAAKAFGDRVSQKESAHRKNLCHLPFVTVDGADAKDFDDAVYCHLEKNNGFRLFVAIADVSYYVEPQSLLDKEAFLRGNSVYFPKTVVPMLPEELSNGLCSLNPQVDRLVMVCEMHITAAGDIANYEFYDAVIYSQARLTYDQTQAMVVDGDVALIEKYKTLLPHLKMLYDVYHVLNAAREKRGAINFDLPETKIIFGKNQKIEKIVPLVRHDAHKMIEECMLCANISAANFLLKHQSPGLFRVHEGPEEKRLNDLRQFLSGIGLSLPGAKKPCPKDYAALLTQIEGRPDAGLIQMGLLRSLKQAIYSEENKGHFGLSYNAYGHFTSPIRRYPDLLMHRAIKGIIAGKPLTKALPWAHYGVHCSMTERRADDATREAIDCLKCEYMMNKIGDTFAGIISSVTNFGFFVQLKNIYIEGLVHVSLLGNDYYQFDPIKQALIGERTQDSYRAGDPVTVIVARVDVDERKIDLALENNTRRGNKKFDAESPKKRRRKHKRRVDE